MKLISLIVIKNTVDEEFDYAMFYNPLRPEIWAVLFALCFMPTFIMAFQEYLMHDDKLTLYSFISRIVKALSSNFGGNFLAQGMKSGQQMAIFAYFINGLIVWICFRASITAGLSQKIFQLPFRNLEELINTNYLLSTTTQEGFTGAIFSNAKPGTIEYQVFQNNMNLKESFNGNIKGLKSLNEIPYRAHFHYTQGILQNMGDLNQCDFLVVWKSQVKHNFALALKKNSKFKGLNQMLLRMDETGELQRLQNQYFLRFRTCQEGSNWSSVGIEKLASIFIFLLICVILSFFCLIFEKLWK